MHEAIRVIYAYFVYFPARATLRKESGPVVTFPARTALRKWSGPVVTLSPPGVGFGNGPARL